MKLLFDHNLSPKLPELLVDLFPQSTHVYHIGLDRSDDQQIWTYAREHGFDIASKDADFSELSLIHGFPPKVVLLRLGNCTTAEVHEAIRRQQGAILDASASTDIGIICVGRAPDPA